MPHARTQQVNGIGHELTAIHSVMGAHAGAIQKIDLDEAKAPLARKRLQHLEDIAAHIDVARVQRICPTPVIAHLDRVASVIAHEPFRTLFKYTRIFSTYERRDP